MDFNTNPRGFRNNNPGNIRLGNDWRGEINGADKSFETFSSIEWGIRALYKIIEAYKNKYNAVSIKDIITRYAPSNENHTSGYINQVYKYMLDHSFTPQSKILLKDKYDTDVHQEALMNLFVAGIILVENGLQPFNFEFIAECEKL